MGPKMHATGHNDPRNEMGVENDEAYGKNAKIQTGRVMTSALNSSTLRAKLSHYRILGRRCETQPEGERSGTLYPAPRVPDREGDDDPRGRVVLFSFFRAVADGVPT